MDYSQKNLQLLNLCLEDFSQSVEDCDIRQLGEKALKKALTFTSNGPSPPLLCLIVTEDMGLEPSELTFSLMRACGYFYTAADLLDDIQDKDSTQPILKEVSPEQCINISNILLMSVISRSFLLIMLS